MSGAEEEGSVEDLDEVVVVVVVEPDLRDDFDDRREVVPFEFLLP